jgi:hypothetical protein
LTPSVPGGAPSSRASPESLTGLATHPARRIDESSRKVIISSRDHLSDKPYAKLLTGATRLSAQACGFLHALNKPRQKRQNAVANLSYRAP